MSRIWAHVCGRRTRVLTARAVDHELSARLDNFVAAVNAEGIKVETVILQGDAVSALVDYTRSVSGELILVVAARPSRQPILVGRNVWQRSRSRGRMSDAHRARPLGVEGWC